jgi:hypothetical protein
MNSHVAYALAHPVYDPDRDITRDHGWREDRLSFVLTCNIGQE